MGSRDHSETCETCGMQRGGLNDLLCFCDKADARTAFLINRWGGTLATLELSERLSTLAANLAIGAALCRAFDLGRVRRMPRDVRWGSRKRYQRPWEPGCGRPVEGM